MILSVIRYVKGYVRIRAEGCSPERFLNACRYRHIDLWGLRPGRGTYEMYVSVRGFGKLKPILKKTGTRVHVTGRFGLPFFLQRYRRRRMLFAGALIGAGLLFGLSLFIWKIEISGNRYRTDESILSFLRTREVYCGMLAGKVDCEQVAADIRKEYGDVIWVSASVEGTKLFIRIKENENYAKEKEEEGAEEPAGSDIVADRDAAVLSIITRQGEPAVEKGDQVKKGETLVSGRLEVKNDAGETVAYQYREAQADIVARYDIAYEDAVDMVCEKREYVREGQNIKKQEEYFLRVGDWLFTVGTIRNQHKQYEYYSEEQDLWQGGSFAVPVSFGKRTKVPYRVREEAYTEEEIRRILSERFADACEDMEKKGLEIIQNDVKIYTEQNKACARGTVTVKGGIGTSSPTEILPPPQADAAEAERDNENNGND